MARLTYIEKEYFEELFGMSTGLVLDFTNASFAEFVYSVIDIKIYDKYQGLSKAKILRKIIKDYDDVTVGKLLLELLNYMEMKKINSNSKESFEKAIEVANRLIGRNISVKRTKTRTIKEEPIKDFIDYEKYLADLIELTNYQSTPQKRGFEFEKYLYTLFKGFNLDPRKSFKIMGEQIDGSFILRDEIYLLEAKWTNKKIDKADLVGFNEKVASKSGFTRGLYISFSGYTKEALETFSNGRTVNIVLMTVEELAIGLERKLNLEKIIWDKIRALAEEGNYNKNILEIY